MRPISRVSAASSQQSGPTRPSPQLGCGGPVATSQRPGELWFPRRPKTQPPHSPSFLTLRGRVFATTARSKQPAQIVLHQLAFCSASIVSRSVSLATALICQVDTVRPSSSTEFTVATEIRPKTPNPRPSSIVIADCKQSVDSAQPPHRRHLAHRNGHQNCTGS